MSQIEKGDMVQLVWGCCAPIREAIGWKGQVFGLRILDTGHLATCDNCYFDTFGVHAELDIFPDASGLNDWIPLSWLIKIEPPSMEETETTDEEITA